MEGGEEGEGGRGLIRGVVFGGESDVLDIG